MPLGRIRNWGGLTLSAAEDVREDGNHGEIYTGNQVHVRGLPQHAG